MVFITEDLIRKRAEHNDGRIFSLEELSLHQLDIEKIEYLDKWCPNLRILYLQSNLISKIENVSRLKKLEYLNLTLNNITCIENLAGCESLMKLDLTLNFIKNVSSISELTDNYNLRELFLVGNPCASFDNYRKYIINTLPQLKSLDGKVIERRERILAKQEYEIVRSNIVAQEQKSEICRNMEGHENLNSEDSFWSKKMENSSETRIRISEELQKLKIERNNSEPKNKIPKRKLYATDGRILNINEAKVQFKFTEDDQSTVLLLDIAVYKYLDTSLIEIDIQTKYVRILIQSKLLQLVLPFEINPDASSVQRAEVTGHLLIKMVKDGTDQRRQYKLGS